MNNQIGENILKYRKINGMTQKFLAAQAGLTVQSLCNIEKGVASPTMRTFNRIMAVLELTPNQLYGIDAIDEKSVVWGNRTKN